MIFYTFNTFNRKNAFQTWGAELKNLLFTSFRIFRSFLLQLRHFVCLFHESATYRCSATLDSNAFGLHLVHMQLTVAEQCGNIAIFKSREVSGKGGSIVLFDPETSSALRPLVSGLSAAWQACHHSPPA